MSAPAQQRTNGHQQTQPAADGASLLDQIIRQTSSQKLQAVKKNLESRVFEMEQLLPTYMKGQADRLIRRAMLTFNRNPKLQKCTPDSLFWCVLNAAEVGLQIDGKLAHAVPYNCKVKGADGVERWQEVAQFQPDYKGLIAVARRSGVIVDIYAELVKEGDKFTHGHRGGDCLLEHFPALAGRGKTLGAYAVVKLKDGWHYEWMDLDDLNRIKAMSKQKGGPWTQHEGEMQRKTVIRRVLKQFCDDQCLSRIMDHMDKEYMEDREAAALNVVLEATQAKVSAGAAVSQAMPDSTSEPMGDEPLTDSHGEIIDPPQDRTHEDDLDIKDAIDDFANRIAVAEKGFPWGDLGAEISRKESVIGKAKVEELLAALRERRAQVDPSPKGNRPSKADMARDIQSRAAGAPA